MADVRVFLAGLAMACLGIGDAYADEAACGLAGRFAYVGELLGSDPAHLFPNDPDMVAVLFADSGRIAIDARVDRFRLVPDGERVYLELHDTQGPVSRINMAGNRDFQYCDGDRLVVERHRANQAAGVYEYSRYRHVARLDERGDMFVESSVVRQYRTWMMTWKRPNETWHVRFPRLPDR